MKASFVATLLAALVAAPAVAQNAAPAQPAPAAPGLQVQEFKPGLDDLMTMLVQPRHLKLYVAAQQKNWELAAFQLRELRASLRRIGQTIPVYRDYPMEASVATMIAPQADALDAAIAAKDTKRFDAAYEDLTDGCNACHQVMEHPFLVIKVPAGASPSLFPDQDFHPKR